MLKIENETLKQNMDELEQYSRRNALRISGIRETPSEDTDKILHKKMGVTLNPEDIDRSHRTGKPNPGRDRKILVKFTKNNVKRAIMKSRWQLKQNTGYHNVYINEDLSKQRQTLFKDTGKLFYEKKATKTWTWDGKVFLLDVHGNKHRIDKHDDLNKFKSASSPSIASSVASQADITVLQTLSPFRIVHYMMAYVVLIFKRNVIAKLNQLKPIFASDVTNFVYTIFVS
ncbi:hypothetical protein KUTeg_007997 [Tegillarca granosa]|uniref:Uncharacterized protein n=1 Tax=Tegillarca granosa TaxID=220873 RepID=A0ABQ9FEU3_TEGGR|nr:hypothetical protein KUTeg_007997 [Tegillarca granosa]